MDLVTLAVAKKYTRDTITEALVGQVDMGDYATTDYVDSKVAELVDTAPEVLDTLNELAAALGDDADYAATVTTQLANKVDKVSGKGLSTNDFTNAYKTKLDAALTSYTETDPTVPAWAKEENKPTYTASEVGAVPTTCTVNGKALSGNITLNATDINALPDTTVIPTTLASLTEDATHRVVTDTEKAAWNSKSNFSGNYNDLANKPTIPSIAGLASETYVNNAVANAMILNSTTEGSTKRFRVTVDDTGALTAVEITE